MKWKIITRDTWEYVEPSTYYPTKEMAEARIPAIELESPHLKDKLKVIQVTR